MMKQKERYLKKKKVIGLMKDELGEKVITEFSELRPKIYSYLIDGGDGNKKRKKSLEKCVIKQKLKFENYKHCLQTTQLENKIKQLENFF